MTTHTGQLLGIARKPKARAAMEELDAIRVDTATGLDGDWRGTPPATGPDDRQVSVLSLESWRAVCEELGTELPWTMRRANLLVDGLKLSFTIGNRITIGDVVLEITSETVPCARMDEQKTGLTAALASNWRGGVCCRVLHGGSIRIGQKIAHEAVG